MELQPRKIASEGVVLEPEIHAITAVVNGSFSPALFQPSWFAAKGLIAEREATAAKIEIIHPKTTAFSTQAFELRVLEDRFQATSLLVPYFESVRDLMVGVFQLIPEMPFRAVGINHTFHFALKSIDVWHQVGHRLAPKDHWNDSMKEPGTLSLSVRGTRDDDHEGYVQVRVEPSTSVKHGLFIDINDHFQLAKLGQEPRTDAREIQSLITEQWEKSSARAEAIVHSVLKLTEK